MLLLRTYRKVCIMEPALLRSYAHRIILPALAGIGTILWNIVDRQANTIRCE